MATPNDHYRLEDRYRATSGRVLLTGIQALARIPLDQLRMDRAAGMNTAALVSGYPGSPLAGLDLEVGRMVASFGDFDLVHRPAVNEELAATAVMGTQLVAGRPDARVDGVVGVWYGKAPGLDRATDAMRHGVFAGTSRHGGAIVLVGDDPMAKSSTMPSSSDAALVDLHMPVLYPGTTQDCLELGLHAVALSRASGLWTAIKVVTPIADGSGTVDLPVLGAAPMMPEIEVDGRPWQCEPDAILLGSRTVAIEQEFRQIRSVIAQRYGAANDLNRIPADPPDAWIGLVATGFTFQQLREALRRLGLTDRHEIEAAGIRLLNLRMPVPFDQDLVRRFARGLDEIVVVEEKNPTLEWLIKDVLYSVPDRPVVVGKTDERGRSLMPSFGRLDADAIIGGLRRRLAARLDDRLVPIERAEPSARPKLIPLSVNRNPFFCSGCPHNLSTRIPDGTLVGAGTGCHGMTMLMGPERVGETIGITAMGNEGGQWIGMAPFVDTDHIVQNLGDGTYLHSGQLAIQAAIGAGAKMTYKILYNDTVAMTGGQEPSHRIGVAELAQVLLAQGVNAVIVTVEDPDGYDSAALPGEVSVWHRERLVEAQTHLAGIDGVTVLIHHQACATELRRDRKRGRAETPSTRIVINHRVCEGCGDCGDTSNCLSVQPFDTPFGRKTRIDQASCNHDLSCLGGDCPAFMTVPVAEANGRVEPTGMDPHHDLGDPVASNTDRVAIRLAGIGGTGVVTAAQIIATAAMLDGWHVQGLDQTGLSQKAGPVVSDLVLRRATVGHTNLIGTGEADVIVAFDELVAAGDGVLTAKGPETVVVGSTHRTPTGAMIANPALAYPSTSELAARLGTSGSDTWVDAAAIATRLVGHPGVANIVVVGCALQTGALPVSPAALDRAIELNAVAVQANRAALAWGRRWVHDPDSVRAALAPDQTGQDRDPAASLPAELARRIDELAMDPELAGAIRLRVADLVAYQNRAYARRYLDLLAGVARAERATGAGSTGLTAAVAHGLHKLMAYKDEYEVARLLLLPQVSTMVEAAGGATKGMTWHLHPPMLRALGFDHKLALGSYARPLLAGLARAKRLRGTRFDPFGRAEVRRVERRLITDYESAIETIARHLRVDNLDRAIAAAELADAVRGYEHLKLERAERFRQRLAAAVDQLTAAHQPTAR